MFSGNKDKLGFRKGMVLAFFNIASLDPQFDEVADFVWCKGVHILGLNETKVDPSILDSLISINGYSLERNDDRNTFGRGVAFYIHKSINYEIVTSLPENSIGILCIKMKPVLTQLLHVLNWYRPPSPKVEKFTELENVLRYLESCADEIFY